MQRGLNIGIGSWIDAQQQGEGRPAFPAIAIPFVLRHLSDLTTPEDLVRAAELSLIANRMGDGGWAHGTGGVPEYLWQRHQDTIGDMVSALSTLSTTERDALARADAVLFKPDGFTISDRYAMYNETRIIYQDLVIQGAAAPEVQLAYQNWVTLGHKVAVEEALAIKTSLSRGTSRLQTAADITRIEMALENLGGDVPFAPTLFSPVSAVSTDHWTEAEVDFQALEDAIRPEVPRTEWARFRGHKSGKVRFKFIAVDLYRPWFSTAVYQADDWRMSGSDVVANGTGEAGRLPSYYARLYMAQVLDVKSASTRPKPSTKPPVLSAPLSSAILRPSVVKLRPQLSAPRPNPVRVAVRPTAVMRGAPAAPPKPRGVTKRRPVSVVSAAVRPTPVIAAHRLTALQTKPHLSIGTAGRLSVIQKLTAVSAVSKLNFVQTQLAAAAISAPRPEEIPDRTTYLVGFGRANLPACPNPNPNYQWP